MTAKYFYISFLLLFTACRQSSNVKYNTINHEQDSIKEIAVNNNDSVLEKIPIKVFYRALVSNEQRIEIDTLSSLTIYKDYIIDKLSMDYYLINIVICYNFNNMNRTIPRYILHQVKRVLM